MLVYLDNILVYLEELIEHIEQVKKILDKVRKAKWFTLIDLQDKYYHLCIKKGDKWKTAFRTRYRYYEFTIIPIGLTNTIASFQR